MINNKQIKPIHKIKVEKKYKIKIIITVEICRNLMGYNMCACACVCICYL